MISFLITGFTLKSPNPYVPDNVATSKIIIIKRDFSEWKSTIDKIPGGYDLQAQMNMFNEYKSTIIDIEKLFQENKVKYFIVNFSENMTIDYGEYKLDYKLNCDGGERIYDGWQCFGGFYFVDLKNGKAYSMMAPDKRAYRNIKKGIRKSNNGYSQCG